METETHKFEFEKYGDEYYFCADGNMPCMLYDKLKEVVKDYYKKD